MKCNYCTADVPPQWVHSINTNQCPSCGKPLMSDEEMNLVVELREAMSKMPANPEGLAGWLLTNYKLTKIGTAEPTEFHEKKPTRSKTVQSDSSDHSGTDLLNKFIARTGVKVKTNEMKEMVARIKNGDSDSLTADMISDDGLDEEIAVSASDNFNDDDGIPPVLKALSEKNRNLQEEIAITGSAGMIRRSS